MTLIASMAWRGGVASMAYGASRVDGVWGASRSPSTRPGDVVAQQARCRTRHAIAATLAKARVDGRSLRATPAWRANAIATPVGRRRRLIKEQERLAGRREKKG